LNTAIVLDESLPTDEIFNDFSFRLANLGPVERQRWVSDLLTLMADSTQGTVEEEVYLRALRAMRNR